MTADAGHEPWARASVKRRNPLTQEQAEDLVAAIDHLRGLLDQQDGQLRDLLVQRANALQIHNVVNLSGARFCDHCRDADEEPTAWPCGTVRALGVTS